MMANNATIGKKLIVLQPFVLLDNCNRRCQKESGSPLIFINVFSISHPASLSIRSESEPGMDKIDNPTILSLSMRSQSRRQQLQILIINEKSPLRDFRIPIVSHYKWQDTYPSISMVAELSSLTAIRIGTEGI